jgi:hypothetical protein
VPLRSAAGRRVGRLLVGRAGASRGWNCLARMVFRAREEVPAAGAYGPALRPAGRLRGGSAAGRRVGASRASRASAGPGLPADGTASCGRYFGRGSKFWQRERTADATAPLQPTRRLRGRSATGRRVGAQPDRRFPRMERPRADGASGARGSLCSANGAQAVETPLDVAPTRGPHTGALGSGDSNRRRRRSSRGLRRVGIEVCCRGPSRQRSDASGGRVAQRRHHRAHG